MAPFQLPMKVFAAALNGSADGALWGPLRAPAGARIPLLDGGCGYEDPRLRPLTGQTACSI